MEVQWDLQSGTQQVRVASAAATIAATTTTDDTENAQCADGFLCTVKVEIG